MQIDTRYKGPLTIVDLVLQSAAERELSDEDFVRIATNQHKLKWTREAGTVEVTPAVLRVKRVTDGATVQRKRDRVTVIVNPDAEQLTEVSHSGLVRR